MSISRKTKSDLDNILVIAFEKPAKTLITGISIWAAISVLVLPAFMQRILDGALRTFFVMMLFWFFYRASSGFVLILENTMNKKINPALPAIIEKVLKFIIVVLGLSIIINDWGYDVSAIITGLGIGGLAISLAAKDTASNFLGSITIMVDKTYGIGDWIQTDKVEGIVESIGFRSTRIRTFYNSLVSVPNSIMSNEPVTNWSKMEKRRAYYTLNISINTPKEKIKELISKVQTMLNENPDVFDKSAMVAINGIKEGTIEIVVYYFTKTTSWFSYIKVTEDINLKILNIFEEMGIQIIVPYQRMIIEGDKTKI
jgi:MscS family membrane protein